MSNLFKKIELFILTLTIMSLIVLVCIQFINIKDDNIINTTKFNDGIKYVPLNSIKEMDSGILILKLLNKEEEDIKVLVNGEIVSDFSKKNEIEVNVSNNDLIEIDGTKYMEKNTVKIIGISKNIKSPKLNTTVSTSQSIEILGKVKLK